MPIPEHIGIIGDIDLFELSKQYMIVSVFYRNNSIYIGEALTFAKAASFFEEVKVANHTATITGFAGTRDDINRLLMISTFVNKWHGTKFYAGGRLLSGYFPFRKTVECYLNSLACINYKAFCLEVIEHPFHKFLNKKPPGANTVEIAFVIGEPSQKEPPPKPSPLFINPCRLLRIDTLSPYHPTSLNEQLQAMSITQNVDWCPHFDTENVAVIEREPVE